LFDPKPQATAFQTVHKRRRLRLRVKRPEGYSFVRRLGLLSAPALVPHKAPLMNRPVSSPVASQLDDEAADVLLDWGLEFDRNWAPGLLETYADALPEPLQAWRKAAIEELVQTDLVRQWERRSEVLVESYLERFPELGTAETVSPELIAAEVEGRRLAGQSVAAAQLEERFPRQAAAVLELVRQAGGDPGERSTHREPAHDAVTRTILRSDEDSVAG